MFLWDSINWSKFKFKKCNDYGDTAVFRNIGFTDSGIKQFSKGLLGDKQYSLCPYCQLNTALRHEVGCPNNPILTIYVD